jgi:hypothetical protein
MNLTRFLLASALCGLLAGSAQAQAPGGGVAPIAGAGQYALTPTTSTALTVPAAVGATATSAYLCVSGTGPLKYTVDGTVPTSTKGLPAAANTCISLQGNATLNALLMICASCTVDVSYYR